MTDAAPDETETTQPRDRLVELGLGAAWLVGLAAALQIVERILGPANLGGVIFGALAVDIAAGRAGVRWDSDEASPTTPRNVPKRVAAGAATATGVALLVVALSALLGWFHIEGPPEPSTALVLALVRVVATAVRDELLFRGIPLAAMARAGVPRAVARAFAALVSGAALVFVPGVSAGALALAVASGWLFAALWERDRGAWAAIGAHAAWALVVGSALHGGVVDAVWKQGELAVGIGASGAPAWVASAVLVLAAALLPKLPWPRASS
jgi:membrane protease YdiL (CAAX protease family)